MLNMEYGEFVAYLSVIQQQEEGRLRQLAIAFRMASADTEAFMDWLKK